MALENTPLARYADICAFCGGGLEEGRHYPDGDSVKPPICTGCWRSATYRPKRYPPKLTPKQALDMSPRLFDPKDLR